MAQWVRQHTAKPNDLSSVPCWLTTTMHVCALVQNS